ncbi:MAG: formylglycine-generating enzyme family protein [Myxococcaceae bacterium]|nr:formylglycine-generating enzyme family protein [Myxococcaceae bacterium]
MKTSRSLLSLFLGLTLAASCATPRGSGQSAAVDAIAWRTVPAGLALLGSDPGTFGHDTDEQPRHEARIASFEMMVHPVTVEQWQMLEAEVKRTEPEGRWWSEAQTPKEWTGRCNLGSSRIKHPANCVDYRAARAFCKTLGGDLPTEAEREYAARAGANTPFFWGTGFDAQHAVSSVSCGTRGCAGSTAEVITTGPRCNAFGLCDLSGNVWEWTATDYQETLGAYVTVPVKTQPARPVHRGGSWLNEKPEMFRVSQRGLNYPTHGLTGVGLRCVKR